MESSPEYLSSTWTPALLSTYYVPGMPLMLTHFIHHLPVLAGLLSCSGRSRRVGHNHFLGSSDVFPLNIITTSGQTVFIGGTPRPRKFSNLPVALEYTPSIVREVRIVLLGFEGGVLFKTPKDPRIEQGRGQQGTEG